MIVRTYHPEANPDLRTLPFVGLANISLADWNALQVWEQASVDASGLWSVTPDPENGLPIMPFISAELSAALQTPAPLVEEPAAAPEVESEATSAPAEDAPADGAEPTPKARKRA